MIAATQFSVNRARSSTPGKRYRIVAPTVNGMSDRYSQAQRSRCDLELQTPRLSGAQEVAVVSRTACTRTAVEPMEVLY